MRLFFVPLSSPNKIVYWECICKLFSIMEHQLSFGVEREVLVDELQYYFEQSAAAEIVEEDFAGADSRGKANGILRQLEYYGWIEIETDTSAGSDEERMVRAEGDCTGFGIYGKKDMKLEQEVIRKN